MKPLDKIFTPDEASLDPAMGPFLRLTKEQWEAHERTTLATQHQEIAALTCLESVPVHIRQNVELSKNLLLYSFFVYEFATAATHYAAVALEASLRRALGKTEECRDNHDIMLEEAVDQGMLSKTDHKLVSAKRFVSSSRNGLAHGKEGRDVLNYTLSFPFVKMVIRAINALFPDNPSTDSP